MLLGCVADFVFCVLMSDGFGLVSKNSSVLKKQKEKMGFLICVERGLLRKSVLQEIKTQGL